MMVLGKTKRTEIYVPEDCIRTIELLCDTQIRAIFKIHNKNQFVFTFGKNVNSHVKGTSIIIIIMVLFYLSVQYYAVLKEIGHQ